MEKIVLILASFLRLLPTIRGRHKMGLLLERILLKRYGFKRESVEIKVNQRYRIIIDPRSEIHKGALYSGVYDDKIIKRFCEIINKDWVVFDVGASIGYWSLAFASKIANIQSGQVVSFEPLPSNNKVLIKNLELNGLLNKVKIMNFALGDKDGQISIHATEKGSTGNAYIGERIDSLNHNFETVVEIKKLDSIISNYSRCDFIKMDIEGAEYFAIKGGYTFIQTFRPIIFGEFNSLFLDNFGFSIKDVDNILRPLGYCAMKEEGNFFKEIVPQHGMEDIMFVPKEKLGLVNIFCDLNLSHRQ